MAVGDKVAFHTNTTDLEATVLEEDVTVTPEEGEWYDEEDNLVRGGEERTYDAFLNVHGYREATQILANAGEGVGEFSAVGGEE